MTHTFKAIAPGLAALLAIGLLGGCCEEEPSDAPAPNAATASDKEAAPADNAGNSANAGTPDGQGGDQGTPADDGLPAAKDGVTPPPIPTDPPPGVDGQPDKDAVPGEDVISEPGEQSDRDPEKLKALGELLEATGEGWEVDYADTDGGAVALVAKEDSMGQYPDFKAGLVKDGKLLGESADFKSLLVASADLSAFSDCKAWSGNQIEALKIGDRQGVRLSFWCNLTDAEQGPPETLELVTIMVAEGTPASLSDFKPAWTGTGGSNKLIEETCMMTASASFSSDNGTSLKRVLRHQANIMAKLNEEGVAVETAPDPDEEPTPTPEQEACKAPEDDEKEFTLQL